jgi:PAS domain-containing protein
VFSVAGIGFATNSKGAFLFYPSGLSTLIDTVFISAMLQLPRLNYLASDEWEGALGGSRVSSEADQTTCAKDRRIAELEWQLQEAEKENRALRRERTYNRGLIEASLDGLITVDSDLIITDVNEQMCHMVARTRDQLIGTPFASILRNQNVRPRGCFMLWSREPSTTLSLTCRMRLAGIG